MDRYVVTDNIKLDGTTDSAIHLNRWRQFTDRMRSRSSTVLLCRGVDPRFHTNPADTSEAVRNMR